MRKKILFIAACVAIAFAVWGAEQLQRGEVTTSLLGRQLLTNTTAQNMLGFLGVVSNTVTLYNGSQITNLNSIPLSTVTNAGTAGYSNSASFQPANGAWKQTNGLAAGMVGGTTNDTSILQGLLDRGINVYLPSLPNGATYTTLSLYLTNGAGLIGIGTKLTLHSSVSNAALINIPVGNTNVEVSGFDFYGGAMGGIMGTTNRIAVSSYAYGQGNAVHDCRAFGFDFGFKFLGDKTTQTSHQSPKTRYYGLSCASNYCAYYIDSPDGTHVVEYLTFNMCDAYFNHWGIFKNAGNNNFLACHIDNNDVAYVIPGTGVNNSHGLFSGGSMNHNTVLTAWTNIISGEKITGALLFANNDSYFDGCRGVDISDNAISATYFRFYNGSISTPNKFAGNACSGSFMGGQAGDVSIVNDGSCVHWGNLGRDTQTGDGFLSTRTNGYTAGPGRDMDLTNSFAFWRSNNLALYMDENVNGAIVTTPIVTSVGGILTNATFIKSTQVRSNTLANWPTAPETPGAFADVNSNGYPYRLLSTNGSGVGSASWTGTNKLGW